MNTRRFRLVSGVLLILFWAQPGLARPRHWYTDRKFWVSEGVIGTAIFLDYHSTAARPYGSETNPFLGTHPSNRRIAGIGLLDFGAETGFNLAFYKIARIGGQANETRTWNTLGYITEPAISLATHLPAAIHNYRLPRAGEDSGILR